MLSPGGSVCTSSIIICRHKVKILTRGHTHACKRECIYGRCMTVLLDIICAGHWKRQQQKTWIGLHIVHSTGKLMKRSSFFMTLHHKLIHVNLRFCFIILNSVLNSGYNKLVQKLKCLLYMYTIFTKIGFDKVNTTKIDPQIPTCNYLRISSLFSTFKATQVNV